MTAQFPPNNIAFHSRTLFCGKVLQSDRVYASI